MQINIRTSEANLEVVRTLTKKLPTGSKENVIARIALGFSLQKGVKFSESEFNKYDSKGKEYKEHILFDQNKDYYIALICQHYGIYKTDENIPKYMKLHIDDGLERMNKIFSNSNNYTFMDFLMDNLENGIKMLDDSNSEYSFAKNYNLGIEKNFYQDAINIAIGKTLQGENINFSFNKSDLYSNNHIAVAGNSGTGKTQFALSLLQQISQNSNHKVNFIYLDFKGLKGDDAEKLKPFFDSTHTELIDVPNKPFPVNPLSFIDGINEQNKKMGIDKFVDIITKYQSLGIKQQGKLREAIKECFKDQKPKEYPSLQEINEKLIEIVGEDKKDSLTQIIEDLSRYTIFSNGKTLDTNFLERNLYLSLSGDLAPQIRFTSLFLIINYIYNMFMNMENTPVSDEGYRAMRYVILIDEAHVIFKEKKYHDILEKILREIRSKGVSVILLSQGIEEYITSSFDFSSMCQIAFLLPIKDLTNNKIINKFMGFSDKDSLKASKSLERISNGQAITNIAEYTKGELFDVSQYWKMNQ